MGLGGKNPESQSQLSQLSQENATDQGQYLSPLSPGDRLEVGDYHNWVLYLCLALSSPGRAQNLLEKSGQPLGVSSSLLFRSGHTQDEISLPVKHLQLAILTV